ncbi:MAG: hypothetical protein NWF10_05635 [Candidatus Bathyarchaeota archaeon]|nr:hypothetical protein [Candidatus Bathyarchaeota archaeon]
MNRIYCSKNHPDGLQTDPYYIIRENKLFTTNSHPDGLQTDPYYIIRE